MSASSARLRMMTQYSWHVIRAAGERERAAASRNEHVARIHAELAELHLDAAADLSEAWRGLNVPDTDEADPGAIVIRPLIALLSAEDSATAQLLLPPALDAADD